MFASRDFVFIHIPKTGGQTVLHSLEQHQEIFCGFIGNYHMNVNDAQHPQYDKDKPTLAFVRNPWSWYASWYHYLLSAKKSVYLFDIVSDDKKNDFPTSINNLFDMIEGKRDDLVEMYDSKVKYMNHPIETLKGNFYQLSEWDCGLLSWNYFYLIFGDKSNVNYDNVTIGKQENLKEDLFNFLINQNIIEKDSEKPRKRMRYNIMDRMLKSTHRVNVTKDYGDYQQYYDDALIERVYDKEKYIVDRYGYKFN